MPSTRCRDGSHGSDFRERSSSDSADQALRYQAKAVASMQALFSGCQRGQYAPVPLLSPSGEVRCVEPFATQQFAEAAGWTGIGMP